jgi:adenosine deaminase
MHRWTEKIQSSPLAIERSVYEIIGKEYRGSRVTTIELRFNPMKRNKGGEQDLDHIIQAAIRGMDRAALEYGSRAGLVFCLAREFEFRLNEILVEKAIRYRRRGVVGIDLAGPESTGLEGKGEELQRYRDLFRRARAAGLKTTVHTGETAHTAADGLVAAVEALEPDRIGHGVQAAGSERALGMLAERGIVLEICPSSNLATKAVRDLEDLGRILRTFIDRGVRFTINTDGPYLLNTNLAREALLLIDGGALSSDEVARCFETAREATFIAP